MCPDGFYRNLPPLRSRLKFNRRDVLSTLGGAASFAANWSIPARAEVQGGITFGLNPLFLETDIALLRLMQLYLQQRLMRPVSLVRRRTYQEITALLLTGQLDVAWVCDDPYVQHEDAMELLAVPVYQHQPLYRTLVVANKATPARVFDDIQGTVHAFSDPDSTSGYLVTRYELALRHTTPADFFREFFFTYAHRNVVRAVNARLADSGSVDGYVWDVLQQREPALTENIRVVFQSEFLGFPPIVGLKAARDPSLNAAISAAFLDMDRYPLGRQLLAALALDGFTTAKPELYHATLTKWRFVKAQV
ncbi:MAG: PhnD/SsuA/transferrin family substrate-binding protein [Hyphomicrobiales bacterium]|nr:PhnD/SsuA/transferrin family substrate-binding protein [Hyphomicrobiales bacterium]MDE2115937.1 PhnD/SsuA/transferrin family substrate-binding protein [Hyphomicrobiales bacterium]